MVAITRKLADSTLAKYDFELSRFIRPDLDQNIQIWPSLAQTPNVREKPFQATRHPEHVLAAPSSFVVTSPSQVAARHHVPLYWSQAQSLRDPRAYRQRWDGRRVPGERRKHGHILFVRDGALFARRFDPATLELIGDASVISESVAYNAQFRFAPLGAALSGAIAYGDAPGFSTTELTWFDRDGSQRGRLGLPDNYQNPYDPKWSSDGTELFYITMGGNFMVREIIADSNPIRFGDPEVLFQAFVQGPDRYGYSISTYDVTSDGQRFLVNTISEGARSLPLTMILNWTSLLEEDR